MKEIHLTKGPFIQTNNKSKNINNNILLSLIPLIIFAFYKNGIILYGETKNILTLFLPLILILIASLTGIITNFIIAKIRKENKTFKYFLTSKYILPGLILALIFPVDAPIWLLPLITFISVIIGKINISGIPLFNQVAFGAILIIIFNSSELFKTISTTNDSLWTMFFGNTANIITNTFLVLLAFLYLIYKKAIKWKILVTVILTIFIMTYIIGVLNNQTLTYPIYHILSGGLAFLIAYLGSDNETSPTTAFGQITYAIFLGILTVIFRFYVSEILSIYLSILIMNLFNSIIDELGALARFGLKKGSILILIQIILVLGISLYIARNNKIVDNVVITKKI